LFVLRQTRPDKTYRTFWHQEPDETVLKDPALEVVLPEHAQLSDLAPELLSPNRLPGLWENNEISLQALYSYFCGKQVIQVQKNGYTEPLVIPKAESSVVDLAVQEAIRKGLLWLVFGSASIFAEDVPAGLIAPEAMLLPPPAKISTLDVLPERLPEAWSSETTTVLTIAAALSSRYGKPLPWKLVKTALDGAFKVRYLEKTIDSKPWPCDYGDAQWIIVRIPEDVISHPKPDGMTDIYIPGTPSGGRIAEAEMHPDQLQDLADLLGDLLNAAGEYDIKFHLRVEVDENIPEEVVQKLNSLLSGVNNSIKFK